MALTSLILGASVIVKILCGIVLLKVLAVSLTIEQFGRVGQYMTLISLLAAVAGGAQNRSMVVFLSQHADDQDARRTHLRNATTVFIITFVIVACVLVFGRDMIARALVRDVSLAWVSLPIAACFLFAGINNFQIAALSAARNYAALSISQAVGIVVGTLVCVAMTIRWGENGAIVGFAMLGFWNALVSYWPVRKLKLFTLADLKPAFDKGPLRAILGHSLAFSLSMAALPLSYIYVRSVMGASLGWTAVGYWQAIMRFSDAAIQLFGTFFNNYYLGHIAREKDDKSAFRTVVKTATFIVPCAALFYTIGYLLRYPMISIFLSDKYLEAESFVQFQFAGDFFRAVNMLALFYFVGKTKLIKSIGMEIYVAVAFLTISLSILPAYGMITPVISHVLSYGSLTAILMAYGLWRYWGIRRADRS
jgi:PST family polysaccharide transporter